jgi:hypothetical protein
MSIILAIFSVILIAISLYGVVLPLKLTALVRGFMARTGVWGAAAVRLFLAVLLWFSAPVSHTPTTFRVLALLALVAAVVLPIVGSVRLQKLIDRVASWPQIAIRLGCVIGVAFGAFLLWSVSPGLVAA